MKNIFDFNKTGVTVEYFENSPIFIIDNFYKEPSAVIDYINLHPPTLWKSWETPSYNGKCFFDYRHNIVEPQIADVSMFLANLCMQTPAEPSKIITNKITFTDYEFNDYFNNFWAPHIDIGYNGIIYLNEEDTYTNLYSQIDNDSWSGPEHLTPWRQKTKYQIKKQLRGKFNRCILFDGAKFLHGMDIKNDMFFNGKYRLNQTIFFIP